MILNRVGLCLTAFITVGVLLCDLIFSLSEIKVSAVDYAETWSVEDLKEECQLNAKKLWDYCVSNGLTEEATAGIMGNCAAESSFDPYYKILNPDGSYYKWSRGGVVQQYTGNFMMSYQYDVVQNCVKWCKSVNRDPNDITSQVAFVLEAEIITDCFNYRGGKYGIEAFKKMTDIEAATTEFCVCYENCFTSNTAYPDGAAYGKGWQHLGYRIKYAKHCYEYFTGSAPLKPSKDDPSLSTTSVQLSGEFYKMSEDDFVQKIDLRESDIWLPKISDLSAFDRNSIYEWKATAEARKWERLHGIPRGIIVFIGIILIIYATLIYIGYWLDRTNNFIDISALSILSFGKLKISPDGEKTTYNTDDGIKVVVHKDVIFITLIGIAIGVLVVSGKVYDLIGFILDLVDKVLNNLV